MILKNRRQRANTPRRFALVAALALIVGGVVTVPLPASAATDNSKVESSILLVATTWSGYVHVPSYDSADGEGFWTKDPVNASVFCTGWFVSPKGHIVTAGHCVDPIIGREEIIKQFLFDQEISPDSKTYSSALVNWEVAGPHEGDPISTNVQVIQPDDVPGAVITNKPLTAQVVTFRKFSDGDIALLRVAGLKTTPALTIANSHPNVGDSLTAIGFPGSVQVVSDGSRIRASFKSGTASSQQYTTDGVAGTEVNADISPGMSGGPTVNSKGEVLGVNSYTISNENQNFNFITDTDDLATFLESNNVPYVPASKDDGLGWIWIVLVIGIVLVLAAAGFAVWFFVFRKKNTTQTTPLAPQPQWSPPQQPLPPGSPAYAAPLQEAASPPVIVMEQPAPSPEVTEQGEQVEPEVPAEPPTQVWCSACGTPYPVGTHFCSKDGTPLPSS